MRMNDPAAPPGDDSFGDRGNVRSRIISVAAHLIYPSSTFRMLSVCFYISNAFIYYLSVAKLSLISEIN